MGKIIDFHGSPVANIKRELAEKEKELDLTRHELAFFKRMYSQTSSVNDLLKLEVSDLNANIVILQGHLKLIQDNLGTLKGRLEQVDKQKAQVQVVDPNKKDS